MKNLFNEELRMKNEESYSMKYLFNEESYSMKYLLINRFKKLARTSRNLTASPCRV